MRRSATPAEALVQRMCRPQRVGVFGQRGVGKTTLLTMLYREAVGGKLPELRLAAADARTAEYLSDKVVQLESGRPLPATLGETELRLHLYYRDTRLDLLFKDYQGEHVALGRQEPIRSFLLDCDAVWLCLDVPLAANPAGRLRAQQEVEQIVEDYLGAEPQGPLHRPMAMVLTKADLLRQPAGDTTAGPSLPLPVSPQARALAPRGGAEELVEHRFPMTRHALRVHCPQHALFAVSSLGGPIGGEDAAKPFTPQPLGLDGPLAWLAQALQAQDEARLAQLWEQSGRNLALLGRCLACFRHRYPSAAAGRDYAARLQELRRRRRRRRGLAAFVAVACLVLGVGTYDAVGEQRVERFTREHGDDPVAVREEFQGYQTWHPTRNLFRPAAAHAEQQRLRQLDVQVRDRQRAERLAALRLRAADPDADPEALWQQLRAFRADFPEQAVEAELPDLAGALKARRDADRERRARDAFARLQRLETRGDLALLTEYAERFLRDYPGTSHAAEVKGRRDKYLLLLDQREIDEARAYSAANPLNFHTRRECYQRYLERHPEGASVKEAREAVAAVEADWDKHDFRQVRDHFRDHPGDLKELDKLCRSYLAAHPKGRFAPSARDLLRWSEQVSQPGEYRVVLKSGSFDKKVAAWFSRGPSLSVELEVGGVRYGPSNVVSRSYSPEWAYEFPRGIRWKMGDTVRIVVTDHYFWDRTVVQIASEDGDPFALRLLSGEAQSGKNSLTFSCDFRMPDLPRIE
jgi:hypothetical protein